MRTKLSIGKAFSLIEVSIALLILGITCSGGLQLFNGLYVKHKMQVTGHKLEQIKQALNQYAKRYGYLPSPSARFEWGSSDVLVDVGFVPYKTLKLPSSYAVDGYNKPINYALHQHYKKPAEQKIARLCVLFDKMGHLVELPKHCVGFCYKGAKIEESMRHEFIKTQKDMHSKVNAVMCEVANPVVYVLGEFDVRNVKNAQSGEQLEVISKSKMLIIRRCEIDKCKQYKPIMMQMIQLSVNKHNKDQVKEEEQHGVKWQTHTYTHARLFPIIKGMLYKPKVVNKLPGIYMDE